VTEIVIKGLLGEIDAGRLQLLVEGDVGAADDDRVDHVRLHQLHLVDDGVELRAAEREILLADDLELEDILDVLARDLVGRARPDVVGAEQVEGFGALLLFHPVQSGENLLGGFLAGVDDVLRLLEAFVEGRVVEHAVVLLEHRQHRLARG
jgi:hypothetical protein